MKQITLGSTGIVTPQNAFGSLPIQRITMDTAVQLLRRAYDGGITFFDTARAYSDSEEKIGCALSDVRKNITLATKTAASSPDEMKQHLEDSLTILKTDYIDLYQFHWANRCYQPGDGSGLYETMEDFKRQGLIRHIGITCHKIGVAEECAASGLYETIQFPFSCLSDERDIALVHLCREKNIGFIAMKALSGGLITNSRMAMAFMTQFDNVVPIWGIQHAHELEEWLSYMHDTPVLDDDMRALIESEKDALGMDFCRGCGYCLPCPKNILINQCARMALMLRRSPSAGFLSDYWKAEMERTTECVNCGTCMTRCPYELNTPALLRKNYEDYKKVLAGEVSITNL